MKFVTLDEAKAACRADDEDDALLTLYVNAAEAACMRYCGRTIFKDATEQNTATEGLQSAMTAARDALDAANAAADLIEVPELACLARAQAQRVYVKAIRKIDYDMVGQVAEDDFKAAVLMTLGHFYRNREDVASDLIAVPQNSRFYLDPYVYQGV